MTHTHTHQILLVKLRLRAEEYGLKRWLEFVQSQRVRCTTTPLIEQTKCQWLNALKKSRPETMSWVSTITFNIYGVTCDFAECGQIRLATGHFKLQSVWLPSRLRPAVMNQCLLLLLFCAFPILVTMTLSRGCANLALSWHYQPNYCCSV